MGELGWSDLGEKLAFEKSPKERQSEHAAPKGPAFYVERIGNCEVQRLGGPGDLWNKKVSAAVARRRVRPAGQLHDGAEFSPPTLSASPSGTRCSRSRNTREKGTCAAEGSSEHARSPLKGLPEKRATPASAQLRVLAPPEVRSAGPAAVGARSRASLPGGLLPCRLFLGSVSPLPRLRPSCRTCHTCVIFQRLRNGPAASFTHTLGKNSGEESTRSCLFRRVAEWPSAGSEARPGADTLRSGVKGPFPTSEVLTKSLSCLGWPWTCGPPTSVSWGCWKHSQGLETPGNASKQSPPRHPT
ncbi:uncharacterized protein LOC104857856 [Fukomys damarensis]|uniref:uncharacterized protein LOC104857856 n=1 Tax=Fukomys damarensis TaxID=885580 RepID=UPI0005402968|nr:uncharacterized protein LOC104857856 [Fukomys damarensis]